MSEAKYKVGDKVKVRSDLVDRQRYGTDTYVEGFMGEYLGKEIVIHEVTHNGKYRVKESDMNFTDEMLVDGPLAIGEILTNNDRAYDLKVVAVIKNSKDELYIVAEDQDGTHDLRMNSLENLEEAGWALVPEVTELTLEQIAEKFNLSVDQIRVKK